MVHMETLDTIMVNRVSPAARSAWGSVKDSGQIAMPQMPCIQMMVRA